MSNNIKDLYRPQEGRWLNGVCAGLGEFFNIDPTFVRVIFIFSAFVLPPPVPVIAYFILAIVIPKEANSYIEGPTDET